MFRKLILASTVALGLAVPLSLPATASARPRVEVALHIGPPVHRVYRPAPVIVTVPEPVAVYSPPVAVYRPIHHHYRVLYRPCAAEPWVQYGTYQSRFLAHERQDRLAVRGFETQMIRY